MNKNEMENKKGFPGPGMPPPPGAPKGDKEGFPGGPDMPPPPGGFKGKKKKGFPGGPGGMPPFMDPSKMTELPGLGEPPEVFKR